MDENDRRIMKALFPQSVYMLTGRGYYTWYTICNEYTYLYEGNLLAPDLVDSHLWQA